MVSLLHSNNYYTVNEIIMESEEIDFRVVD